MTTVEPEAEVCDVGSAEDFVLLLRRMSGLDAELSPHAAAAVEQMLEELGLVSCLDVRTVETHFCGLLNVKMGVNADALAAIYLEAAGHGVTFNYHAKKAIAWAVDHSSADLYRNALAQYCPDLEVAERLLSYFRAASFEDTREALAAETTRPTKLRKALQRDVAIDVVDSAAGCLAWSVWDRRALRSHFDSFGDAFALDDDFLAGLRRRKPELFERSRSLVLRFLEDSVLASGYEHARERLTAWIASEYEGIDNYGHLCIAIPTDGGLAKRAWELAADLTLFAERFDQYAFDRLYFRSADVARETCEYVPDRDAQASRFDHISEGFTYRDLFVLHDDDGQTARLVLLFQKNRRDETPIPCPACRSTGVQGNSYPSFGVKSWECGNPLCPERSIYNRGKRYSFKALLAQEAIENAANTIPVESVRRWRRDVLSFRGDEDIIEWAIRHYPMESDVVVLIGRDGEPPRLGRRIQVEDAPDAPERSDFWSSPFFARYLPRTVVSPNDANSDPPDVALEIMLGDSAEVLAGIANDSFDRAVTSPPYFNAREYSQWPNLYCYLHDMAVLHREVFRVLRPGRLYAFNVFDYFDNERTITYSAMGQKRLALSALFVDLFRRLGFEVVGNLVWDKGDIEGKRSFNAGNFSPFYQAPLNCWEHVLLFRKPGEADDGQDASLPESGRVLRIQPVKKMVRGENRHGHSAPYPQELAEAALAGLPPGSLVLDPFGGSGTTARAALSLGLRSVVVEANAEYHALAERMTRDHVSQMTAESALPKLF